MKCDEEMRAREEAEQALRSYRKDVDDATAVRLDLERRVESLLDEISFIRKMHDEEIQELSSMMEAQQVSVEMDLAKPDLTSALKEIRNQYESIASKNLQSAEEWYKSKFASLSEQATRSNETMRASREELSEFRRQLQSKTIEIETLRGANESLERQIAEMEDSHNSEVTNMQASCRTLQTCPAIPLPTSRVSSPNFNTQARYVFAAIAAISLTMMGRLFKLTVGITLHFGFCAKLHKQNKIHTTLRY